MEFLVLSKGINSNIILYLHIFIVFVGFNLFNLQAYTNPEFLIIYELNMNNA